MSSAALGLPRFNRTAAGSLFRPGGDTYTILSDPIFDRLGELLLEPAWKWLRELILNKAARVLWFLVKLAQGGALDERVTTQRIAQAAETSERTVYYVLWALKLLGIIKSTRSHGRRTIEFVRGFAPPGTPSPPAPPIKTEETMTTREPSSSLSFTEEKAGEGREIASPELVELVKRAMELIPEATPGKVADAVAFFNADWVSQALDIVVKRNGKSGKKPVESWGFVVVILERWKRQGGPPAPKPTAPSIQARAKVEPPKEEPEPPLTAEEVRELIRRARSSRSADTPALARVHLRKALANGLISAELEADIPDDLKPRAP